MQIPLLLALFVLLSNCTSPPNGLKAKSFETNDDAQQQVTHTTDTPIEAPVDSNTGEEKKLYLVYSIYVDEFYNPYILAPNPLSDQNTVYCPTPDYNQVPDSETSPSLMGLPLVLPHSNEESETDEQEDETEHEHAGQDDQEEDNEYTSTQVPVHFEDIPEEEEEQEQEDLQ